MIELADVAAAILDNIHLVAVMNCLNSRQRNAGLSPQASQNDFFPAGFFYRSDEILVIPGIHARPFDWLVFGEDRLDLRPHVAAKTLSFHGREHHWDAEYAGSFCQRDVVVNNGLPIEV